VPEARAVHVGSASLGRWHPETVRRISRNQVFLSARHPAVGRPWQSLVAQGLWGCLAIRHAAGFAWLRGKCEGLRHFSALRNKPASAPELLEQFLYSNEHFIREYDAETFWRLYFLLTPGAK
jgi:hypothetical protein